MNSLKSFKPTQSQMALCLMLVLSSAAYAQVPVIGGDPMATFLQRVLLWFVGTPGRTLVVLATAFWCCRLMFSSRHDYSGAAAFCLGALGILFLQTMVSYWLG